MKDHPMKACYTLVCLVTAVLISPLTVFASSHDESGGGGGEVPSSSSFNILGIGQLVGQSSDTVNDTSNYFGTGDLSGTTFSYTMVQELTNIFGVTSFFLEGEIDIVSGAGFDVLTSCVGDDIMCNSATLESPYPFLADLIYQDLGAGAIFWTDSAIVDTGAFGLADMHSSFAATESTRTAVAPMALPSTVPVPAAIWLFGSALIGLAGIKRKK
jgi:hypothetical protein